MKVLLSIKPEYANKIFSGQKKYEYRRSIFKRGDIKKVLVYATAPLSKVIGEFEVDKIIYDELTELWEETRDDSGISEEFFYSYFKEKNKGYAIKIKNFVRYKSPLNLKTQFGVLPPQSFIYLD
jgi:predicted transcriptional regulator